MNNNNTNDMIIIMMMMIIIIIITIIRGHTLKDCIILPASRLSVGNISLQTDVYEIFSQFSTKFNQNLMEWSLVYMANASTNFHETWCNIYFTRYMYSICSVLHRQSRDTNRIDRQTNKQTNRGKK